jgi:hypothetical protein
VQVTVNIGAAASTIFTGIPSSFSKCVGGTSRGGERFRRV